MVADSLSPAKIFNIPASSKKNSPTAVVSAVMYVSQLEESDPQRTVCVTVQTG